MMTFETAVAQNEAHYEMIIVGGGGLNPDWGFVDTKGISTIAIRGGQAEAG